MTARTKTFAAERLSSFIERIERIEEERAAIAADIREVYSEAKGAGFDVKSMRKVVSLRKLEPAERAEQQEILDIYLEALGMDTASPSMFDPMVTKAAALFNAGATVDAAAAELQVSRAEAGRLRERAEGAGLVEPARKGRRPGAKNVSAKEKPETLPPAPAAPAVEIIEQKNVSENPDAETLATQGPIDGQAVASAEGVPERVPASAGPSHPPSPTPMEATGGVTSKGEIGFREGVAAAPSTAARRLPQSHQPPVPELPPFLDRSLARAT